MARVQNREKSVVEELVGYGDVYGEFFKFGVGYLLTFIRVYPKICTRMKQQENWRLQKPESLAFSVKMH